MACSCICQAGTDVDYARFLGSIPLMNILILGAGQVGTTAAYSLAREEANEVTIVDRDPEVLRELQDRLDVRTVVGYAAYPEVLERAGARDADMVIALTNSDEINMVACEVASHLFHTPMRVARIRAAEYMAHDELYGPEAVALNVMISPEELVTTHIEELIHFPGALQVLEFAKGKVRLVAALAHEGGALVGRPLRELSKHIPNREGNNRKPMRYIVSMHVRCLGSGSPGGG